MTDSAQYSHGTQCCDGSERILWVQIQRAAVSHITLMADNGDCNDLQYAGQ